MLGTELKKLRIERNMSQADLSKLTGIPQTSISDVENNRYIPKITTCLELASALDVDLKHLLDSIEDLKAS
ncbi:helix-turn-helix transcriptional regulator [Acetobacterium tundrae]|uniref:Helix-turn-helix domain-containing protein n=1 Tax=Acetobacterium tundrae TaxID=132932 RepID=A0ABR6WQ36_9FIRM|nr:helix-turn-helix transcriptional regulator [Acetobacterium tundrae]MBC3798469.1 helix-turn-helix domain-containing protein [Acetobacterium tundrae]